jgi:alkylhydroperoxidase family enzyme
MAHTLLGAKNFGISQEKLAAVWNYNHSALFTEAERAALDYALAAAGQPGAVDDALMARMKMHWSQAQIVEILGVVAMFGFLNRWNDAMATPLEAVPLAVAQQANPAFGAGKHADERADRGGA